MTEAPPPFATVLTDAYLSALESARDHGVTLTLDDENGIRNALISPIRAAMIRDEFNRAREQGIKSEAVQVELAEKYGVSYACVHQIVIYRR
jgi:hypothetical protein